MANKDEIFASMIICSAKSNVQMEERSFGARAKAKAQLRTPFLVPIPCAHGLVHVWAFGKQCSYDGTTANTTLEARNLLITTNMCKIFHNIFKSLNCQLDLKSSSKILNGFWNATSNKKLIQTFHQNHWNVKRLSEWFFSMPQNIKRNAFSK